MNRLDFSNKYFENAEVTIQGNFLKKYQKHLFRELSGSLLRHLELDMHWKKLNGIQGRLLTCFRF